MRKYGAVMPQFWIGETGKAIRDAGKDARILATYLITAPSANMIGLYYLPIPTIVHESGLTSDEVASAFVALSSNPVRFCYYDQQSEMVWIPEMARFQIGETLKSNDKQIRGIERAVSDLPKNPFTVQFYATYGEAYNLSMKGLRRPIEGSSKEENGAGSPYVLVPDPVHVSVPDRSIWFNETVRYKPENVLLIPMIECAGWKGRLADLASSHGPDRLRDALPPLTAKAKWYRDTHSTAPTADQLWPWYREKCEHYSAPEKNQNDAALQAWIEGKA